MIQKMTKSCPVTKTGNSVVLVITDIAKPMGLKRGDWVEVTIRRIEDTGEGAE